jgi:hypothetical protein
MWLQIFPLTPFRLKRRWQKYARHLRVGKTQNFTRR